MINRGHDYDYEVDKEIGDIYDSLCDEIRTFNTMLRITPKTPNLSGEESSDIDELIRDINFNIEEKYLKMLYTNFYTITDEYLGKIYKTICMYDSNLINKKEVRVEFNEVINKENECELLEIFIDNIIDQKLGNISLKISEINKICKEHFGFKLNRTFIDELEIFRLERNSLVHFGGKVHKKNFNVLSNVYPDIKINDSIIYTSEKVETLLDLVNCEIEKFYCQIYNFYNPDNKIEVKSFKDVLEEITNSN